jgi:hypothetical protein
MSDTPLQAKSHNKLEEINDQVILYVVPQLAKSAGNEAGSCTYKAWV